MYIVYENENNLKQLRSKYLVLELDTIEIKKGEFRKAYAVVTTEHIFLDEIGSLGDKKALHEDLIKNYKLQNWDSCDETISKLNGSFKGELDSFYEIFSLRISHLKNSELDDNWNGAIPASKAF